LYRPLGDEPLAARAVRLLGEKFAEVLVVVRDEAQAGLYREVLWPFLTESEKARVRLVADDDAGENAAVPQAALVGVLSAMRAATFERVVVLPVDQVGVRAWHIAELPQRGHFVGQPFPSAWLKSDTERVAARITAGALGVHATLVDMDVEGKPAGFERDLSINTNTKEELTAYFGEPLFDPFKRRLHYLRLSLTEACNMSCTYCLPDGFPEWYRHKARLGLPEVTTLLSGFRRLGFRKVRFTGGEPTVHPHCLDAVRIARELGYERIAMTTNGLLVGDVRRWREAGLTHLNVSLDSVDAEVFRKITKSKDLAKVLRVIDDATALGLDVKVNTVLLRSQNGGDAHVSQLLDWALARPITLRFIELMETRLNGSFSAPERVLGSEIEPLIAARGLKPLSPNALAPDLRGPANDFGAPGVWGRIGLINPMSCNFCSKCNRLRVTAQGRLKLCLFGDHDIPLDLESPEAVALNVRRLIDRKPERHHLEDGNYGNVATFRTIGG